MNTSFGLRGVICERFGWTLDYLENKIPWMDVHLMMIDAPRFEPNSENDNEVDEKDKKINLSGKAESLNAFFNKYQS